MGEEERRGWPDLPLPRVGALDLGSSRAGRRGKTELDVRCWLNLTDLFHTQTQSKNYGGICASVIKVGKEDPARHTCWESGTAGRLSTETLDFRELEAGRMGELRDKQGQQCPERQGQREGVEFPDPAAGSPVEAGSPGGLSVAAGEKGEEGPAPSVSRSALPWVEPGSVGDTTCRGLSPQDMAEEGEDKCRVSGQQIQDQHRM